MNTNKPPGTPAPELIHLQGLRKYATFFYLAGLALVAIALLYIGFVYFIEFSAFAVVIAMVHVVLTLFVLADKCLLPGINTLQELKDGNIAVGLALLAIAVLFLACIQFV